MNSEPKTVCWNAIVKNESAIIERCMESMIKEIDYWVVVDTGSTDGTQDIIRNFMEKHGVPGELIERPWKNFSHNRSEALELAENKADYILFCDADMALHVNDRSWKYYLGNTAAYLVDQQAHKDLVYANIRLVNGRMKGDQRMRYWGATHEYCDSIEGGASREHFKYITMLDFGDGGAKADKYERDARLLTEQIRELQELENAGEEERKAAWDSGLLRHAPTLIPRCTFYLAQTWRDSDSPEMALAAYIKRTKLDGWAEENWYSRLQIGLLKEELGYPEAEIIQAYLDAYEYRPQRAESLYHLARYLRIKKRYAMAYVYALTAAYTPKTKDWLFVSSSIYSWKAKDELSVCAYWIGHYKQACQLCDELLSNPDIPEETRERIKENLQYAVNKLGDKQ